jgi:hypothetical protein
VPRYRHRQIGWVIIGVAVAPLVVMTTIALAAETSILLLPIVPVAAILSLFATLTVEVTDAAVEVRFGPGWIRRRIPLGSIASVAAVTNSWARGWGLRMIPGGRLYNVSGFRAIQLTLADGQIVQVGTDDPEGLESALRDAIGVRTLAVDVPAAREHIGLLLAIILGLTGAASVGAIVFASRPIDVKVSSTGVDVRGAGYHAHIASSDIVRVHLDDTLPVVTRRTNGFGANGRWRGHIRLADGRAAQLFVTRSQPPFVTIETRRDPVIVNFDDPERTKALFAQLSASIR